MSELELPELDEALLEVGSALVVGTVSSAGEPRASRASSWRLVDAAGRRVRMAISADDPTVVDNLMPRADRPDPPVAVTGADVATLRSVQLKGRVVAMGDPDAGDLVSIERHLDVFTRKIEATDGHPREIVRRFLPRAYVMVELVVDEAYDQTPGPGAGAVLREP